MHNNILFAVHIDLGDSVTVFLLMHTDINIVVSGQVVASNAYLFVSKHVLTEIYVWRRQGLDIKDILNRLRPRTVSPWIPIPSMEARYYTLFYGQFPASNLS